jgi:hypothetical protein
VDELKALRETVERLQIERLRLIGFLEEHLSPDLVEELLSESHSHSLGGTREHVVVFFSDLRSFTQFSALESVDSVVDHLNQFFHAMTTILFRHGATVDKLRRFASIPGEKAGLRCQPQRWRAHRKEKSSGPEYPGRSSVPIRIEFD